MSKNQRIVVLDLASRHMSMAVCSVLEDKTIKVEERVTEEVKDCMKFGQMPHQHKLGGCLAVVISYLIIVLFPMCGDKKHLIFQSF